MNAEETEKLLDKLTARIEKQVELAQLGNYNKIESLIDKNDEILCKLNEHKNAVLKNFKSRYDNILVLYKKLELMIAAEKSIIENQRQQTDNVRKTLNIYRNSN